MKLTSTTLWVRGTSEGVLPPPGRGVGAGSGGQQLLDPLAVLLLGLQAALVLHALLGLLLQGLLLPLLDLGQQVGLVLQTRPPLAGRERREGNIVTR